MIPQSRTGDPYEKNPTVILLLAAMTLFLFYRQSHRQSFTEGITRAQTARMLAWTVCDMNKDRAKSVEPLIDVDSTLWYADEITTVLAEGIMKKDGDLFHPIDYLTWEEASNIADFFDFAFNSCISKTEAYAA